MSFSFYIFGETAFRCDNYETETEQLFSSVCAPSHMHQVLSIAQRAGTELAQQLLNEGAGKILEEAKNVNQTTQNTV